jgi:hypothetical protein
MAEGLVGMTVMISCESKLAKTEKRAAVPSTRSTEVKYCFVEVARLRGVRRLRRKIRAGREFRAGENNQGAYTHQGKE